MADTVRTSLDVGSVIAETYTIEALIGRGGMGAVFRASHARLPGKRVAIKILRADAVDREALARFRHEAEIASRLAHPNIVQVHDFNTLPDGTPYLVLEYLEGDTLAARIARGAIDLDHALPIVRQIGAALAAAHRAGVVHRDLKPANVLLVAEERDGEVIEVAKLLDFGISKLRGSDTVQTQQSALLGTPQYMAPEQATGQHAEVDERTDLFAFGTIVYEMLAGVPAFAGGSVPEVVFKVVYEAPPPLRDLAPALLVAAVEAVAKAMAKKPDDRFANVPAFVEALTGAPLTVSRPPGSLVYGGRAVTPAQGVRIPTAPAARSNSARVDANAETVATADNRPRRGRWLVAVPVLALAAGAAVYAAVGRGDQRAARAPDAADVAVAATVDARVEPAPAVVDAAVVAVAADAAADAAAAVVARADAGRRGGVAAVPAGPDDPRLAAAERALAGGDAIGAEHVAFAVATDASAAVAARDHAHGLLGAIACTVHNSIEAARGELRQIVEDPRARTRLVEVCRRAGYALE